jgi:hypothetical protein
MASTRVRTLEDEVMTLKGTIRERDEALLGVGREIEVLRVTVHDRDEALRASKNTCGELRDEVMGWQIHSEGKIFVMLWPRSRGPRLMLTWCLCFRVGEGAAGGSGDGLGIEPDANTEEDARGTPSSIGWWRWAASSAREYEAGFIMA